MAGETITKKVASLAELYLEENNLELWDIEFLKEGRDWFLRIYIDKKSHDNADDCISIDDCQEVSRFIGEKLDEKDLIEQNYYLEVSSPGMDRKLITKEHFQRYLGSEINVRLYKSVEGMKKFSAILKEIDDEGYRLITTEGKEIHVEKNILAQARLKPDF